jgi:hypothetical protein
MAPTLPVSFLDPPILFYFLLGGGVSALLAAAICLWARDLKSALVALSGAAIGIWAASRTMGAMMDAGVSVVNATGPVVAGLVWMPLVWVIYRKAASQR